MCRWFAGIGFVPPVGEGIVEEVGARGRTYSGACASPCSRNGLFLDDAPCLPFLRRAAELELPLSIPDAIRVLQPSINLPYPIEGAPVLDMHLLTLRLLENPPLRDISGLRLLIPHLGGSFYVGGTWRQASPAASWRTAWPTGRVLFDTGPSFGNGPPHIALALSTLGSAYLALGSDFPIVPRPETLADAVHHIRGLDLPAIAEQVLGANAVTFFRL